MLRRFVRASLCRMFQVAVVGLVVSLALAASARAAEGEWQSLLDQDSYAKHWQTTGNWSIEDGVVTLTPRQGERGWSRFGAYLWSNKEYDDFQIQFDYMVERGGNSGFYFNVGDKGSPVARGIEVQIYDSYPKGQEGKLGDHDSGGIIPGIPPTRNAAKPAGEWNHFEITVKGDQLTVKLNGEVVNEVNLAERENLKARPSKGYIGFQDHALPLKLKDIKIREL